MTSAGVCGCRPSAAAAGTGSRPDCQAIGNLRARPAAASFFPPSLHAARREAQPGGALGSEVMGPGIVMHHYPGNDIMNGSLLTVESNHFCVLKSRGAILNVYETGQYPVEPRSGPCSAASSRRSTGGSRPGRMRRSLCPRPRAWRRRGAWPSPVNSPSLSMTLTTTSTWTPRKTRSSWSPTCRTRVIC